MRVLSHNTGNLVNFSSHQSPGSSNANTLTTTKKNNHQNAPPRPRDYYSEEEEIYDVPRRQKRPTARAPAADDEEYYVRKRGKSKSRIPVAAPPPVEEFERLHVRDRAPAQPQPPVPPPMPLGVRYGPAMDMEGFAFRRGKGDVGEKKGKKGRKSKSAPVSEESEESEDDEVRVKHVKRPKSKSRNRRREIVEDDEVVYKEKKGGKKAKGKKEKYIEASETESSSEEEEEYAVPVRRGGRPMVAPVPVPVPVPIDDEDSSEEEVVHRRKKKGKMPVEPEYERASRKASKRGKETVRYPSVPKMKSHRRDETESETDTESESETTSDDSDGEIVVRKSERRGRSKGNKAKHRKDDSSGSPNLRAPSVSRKRQQKFIDTGMTPLIASSQNNYSLSLEYEMVKPTRAQSPDFLDQRVRRAAAPRMTCSSNLLTLTPTGHQPRPPARKRNPRPRPSNPELDLPTGTYRGNMAAV